MNRGINASAPQLKADIVDEPAGVAVTLPSSGGMGVCGVASLREPVTFFGQHSLGAVAAVTGCGRRVNRENPGLFRPSQDAFIARELIDGSLNLAVLDGHYHFGHIAVSFMTQLLDSEWRQGKSSADVLEGSSAALHSMVDRYGKSNFKQRTKEGKCFIGMGVCAATAHLSKDGMLTFDHVGDTRCTLLRRDGDSYRIVYESWDHNAVGEEQRSGAAARVYSAKEFATLTRAIAPTAEVAPHHRPEVHPPLSVQPGDWIILSSDGGRAMGFDGWLTALSLNQGVEGFVPYLRDMLEKNIEQNGYADDYTVVAIEVGGLLTRGSI